MDHTEINKIFTFLLPVAYILLVIGQWVAWADPANGIEISIYSSTPLIYWIAYIFGMLLGLFILMRIIIKNDLSNLVKYSGIILIAYSTLSFITLFIVRGYYPYILLTGDVGAHYGIVDYIIQWGHTLIHYPALHILAAIGEVITELSTDYIINITTVIFVIVFILGSNLVVKQCTSNSGARYLSYFIICLLPFGCSSFTLGGWSLSMFIPYLAGFCLSPFALYFILKLYGVSLHNIDTKTSLFLLISILISIIFYHPLIYVIYLLLLFLIIIQQFIFIKYYQNSYKYVSPYLMAICSSGVIFTLWALFIKSSANSSISNLFWTIFGEMEYTSSSTIKTSETIASVFPNMSLAGIIDLGLRNAGLLALVCFVLILLFPIILHNISKIHSQRILCLYSLAFVAGGYYIISLFVNLFVQSGRLLPFILFGGIIGMGILLQYLLDSRYNLHNIKGVMSLLLFVCLIISTIILSVGLYYPTMTESMNTNSQTTHAFVAGNEFYLCYTNHDYDEQSLGVHYLRMVEMAYHSKPILQNGLPVTYYHIFKDTVPHHLNYPSAMYLNQSFSKNTYLSINSNMKLYYSVTPQLKYGTPFFTALDFLHLDNDNSVNLLYNNPSIEIYQII